VSAYWPLVQARLVELLPDLLPDGVVVFDGPSAGGEKGAKQYATVGATSDGDGGSYEQPDSPVSGNFRQERGEVLCELVDWSGDVSVAAKRTEVFGWADLLEASIRADQRLGVLPAGSTSTLAGQLVMTPTAARLVVAISYFVPVSA
jgi:hypothetical protein